jgi:hypothetical protein
MQGHPDKHMQTALKTKLCCNLSGCCRLHVQKLRERSCQQPGTHILQQVQVARQSPLHKIPPSIPATPKICACQLPPKVARCSMHNNLRCSIGARLHGTSFIKGASLGLLKFAEAQQVYTALDKTAAHCMGTPTAPHPSTPPRTTAPGTAHPSSHAYTCIQPGCSFVCF